MLTSPKSQFLVSVLVANNATSAQAHAVVMAVEYALDTSKFARKYGTFFKDQLTSLMADDPVIELVLPEPEVEELEVELVLPAVEDVEEEFVAEFDEIEYDELT